MGVIVPDSMLNKVRELLQQLGPCSIQQLVSYLGHLIPPSNALLYGRGECEVNRKRRPRSTKAQYQGRVKDGRYSLDELTALGRRRRVSNAVWELYKRGAIVRLEKGVYGPLPVAHTTHTNGTEVKTTLSHRVQRLVEILGPVPASLITDCIARFIPDEVALRSYQTVKAAQKRVYVPPVPRQIEQGRHHLILTWLSGLVSRGLIKRLSMAVYGPVDRPKVDKPKVGRRKKTRKSTPKQVEKPLTKRLRKRTIA